MCPPREVVAVKYSERELFSIALVSRQSPFEIAFAWTHLVVTPFDTLSPRSKIFGCFARSLAVTTTVRVFPRTSVSAAGELDGAVRVVDIASAATQFELDLPHDIVRAVILHVPKNAQASKKARAKLTAATECVSRTCQEDGVMFAAFDVEHDLPSLDAFVNQVVFQCRTRRQEKLRAVLAPPSTTRTVVACAAAAVAVAAVAALLAQWH